VLQPPGNTQFATSVADGISICNFLADTFLVLQMPINILPLNMHSLDTFPNTPDANCETVSGKWWDIELNKIILADIKMNPIKIIIAGLFAFTYFTGIGQTKIKKTIAENYKTKEFNCAIFPSSYDEIPMGSSQRFTPTRAEVDKAELALKNKLADIAKDQPIIYKELSHYRRQYFGYKDKNGKKILMINCMWSDDDNIDKKWLNEYIMTLDGGSNYWNINYNVDTDTLFELSVNGEA
jgi:hypothetical protein